MSCRRAATTSGSKQRVTEHRAHSICCGTGQEDEQVVWKHRSISSATLLSLGQAAGRASQRTYGIEGTATAC